MNTETLEPSSLTKQATVVIATKSDNNNDEAKEARVVTFEIPESVAKAVTMVPVEEVAQTGYVAKAA